ncbi:2-amino-4-hydroxy-6-hydroxymethyldihydropteridine diphosphokinase [Lipingzhangella sp. LS1_29]|uniref:2-amino-4-hydroxy-6-hydroxymethyldihydropteridine diphosphokinase n=1 Tax=Lipingzhangella rawalii TaxID=2055835 RepID=A0ABU2H9C6_9ACTN|nr:2-amino-4-hydroxy-6-hydroxymethyldihydropteridine diphosphokinase [Lipingzhangella rawalii]MDS1271919.1 2-amino-4-hydroxy-6-hydroxymethyldihydropteridine diphosphokinase [Lipingzhangella rawalii]
MQQTQDMSQARTVVLALGSNLGERLDNLQGALDGLFEAPGMELTGVSPVYETVPVGGPPQPNFLNAVVLARTMLEGAAVLERARGIEEALHRLRDVRWGPRPIDVDIITLGQEYSAAPELTLPHPRAHERAFVLRPWADVDPDAELLGHGRVGDLLDAVADQEVLRRDDLPLRLPG